MVTPNLDELQKDLEQKNQASLDAQKAHSDADAAFRAARSASFNKQLVQTARDWGINPDNFETEEALQAAVDNFPENEKPKAPEASSKLTPELLADATSLGIDVSKIDDDETLKNAIFKAEQKKQENPDIAPAE